MRTAIFQRTLRTTTGQYQNDRSTKDLHSPDREREVGAQTAIECRRVPFRMYKVKPSEAANAVATRRRIKMDQCFPWRLMTLISFGEVLTYFLMVPITYETGPTSFSILLAPGFKQ